MPELTREELKRKLATVEDELRGLCVGPAEGLHGVVEQVKGLLRVHRGTRTGEAAETIYRLEQELATARLTIKTQMDMHNTMGLAWSEKARIQDDRIAALESDCKLRYDRAMANGIYATMLKNAILWALGERGDWPTREPGQGAFYWRTELRKILDEATGKAKEWGAWDSAKPTQPGWYWFKASDKNEQTGVVCVFRSTSGQLFGHVMVPEAYSFEPNVPMCEIDGIWQGPFGPQERHTGGEPRARTGPTDLLSGIASLPAPPCVAAGQRWINIITGKTMIRNHDNAAWIDGSGDTEPPEAQQSPQ